MATLQQLLVEEGFDKRKLTKKQKKVKFKDALTQNESTALPRYICHDRKSLELPRGKSRRQSESSVASWQREGTDSESRSIRRSTAEGSLRRDEPAIDLVAMKAVVSILSGYIGQYLNDKNFRAMIKEKCYSCFAPKNNEPDDGIFANMELGIESVERLVESKGTKNELKVKSLQYSIRLLSIVASLNSKNLTGGSTCGTPNSHLSACAQLYLAIVYRLERNDRISARHLLQVFCDSPFLARTHLLPELWEHLFLPHLLHIKVWYKGQVDIVSNLDLVVKEKKMKSLNEIYNDQMDYGTKQFAAYYKEWLKVGAEAPVTPSVPLPSRSYVPSRRKSSDSFTSQSSIKSKSLYQVVFGPTRRQQSLDLNFLDGVASDPWSLKEEDKSIVPHSTNFVISKKEAKADRRSSSQSFTRLKNEFRLNSQMSGYFPSIGCTNGSIQPSICENYVVRDETVKEAEDIQTSMTSNLYKACRDISLSDDPHDSEMAIRLMAKVCLDSCGDPAIEKTLSEVPVIEGILEVMHASNDNEIMELAISILAELVTRNEKNAKTILNSDPQLHIFISLLRNPSLFLKAAGLLYMMKPKAKHMVSIEWIPLVLRVLEFGDQLQTLFTVQCSPQVAAYYLLNQVLTGFDEDKFFENARQVISLGGLRLLVKRMEIGDHQERNEAVSIIYYCIKADGSCRHYLVKNLKKNSFIDFLAVGKDKNSHGFALLTELLCLNRITQRVEFLRGLVSGKVCLNLMHILLVYLQKARPEELLMIAAVLLQLDLLGEPFEYSVCREEAIGAMIEALDCQVLNEKVQQQSARALMILGGQFSYKGEPQIQKWLLKKAGFDNNMGNSFQGRQITLEFMHLNEDGDGIENWQRKAALILYTRGNKKFLSALSEAITNGIPCLARASLVTMSWMSSFLHSTSDKNLQSVACSIFVPQLVEGLKNDKAVEDRVLASFALFNLMKSSDYMSTFPPFEKEVLGHLHALSHVTWTAKELISILKGSSRNPVPALDTTPP